jgi:hypothetical protein
MPKKISIETITNSDDIDKNTTTDIPLNFTLNDKDLNLNDVVDDKDEKSKPLINISKIITGTIKQGTILYHQTNIKEIFDPVKINLTNGECLSAFFSDNKNVAKERIGNCLNYPNQNGYIHIFKVKIDIENIYILSQYDLSDWNQNIIEKKYCNGINQDNDKYEGVGFYLLKKPLLENQQLFEENIASKEYAICNPKRYLEYIGTIRCQGVRTFSQSYKINDI